MMSFEKATQAQQDTSERGLPDPMLFPRNIRGLWEVRSSLPHGRIACVLFCDVEEKMVLHAFIKKTQ